VEAGHASGAALVVRGGRRERAAVEETDAVTRRAVHVYGTRDAPATLTFVQRSHAAALSRRRSRDWSSSRLSVLDDKLNEAQKERVLALGRSHSTVGWPPQQERQRRAQERERFARSAELPELLQDERGAIAPLPKALARKGSLLPPVSSPKSRAEWQ
jgi:hypothetical protein